MLTFNIKSAFEVFGLDRIPPQPDGDRVTAETWEVWTKNGHRSLWRVVHYEDGWMDWCLTNVDHGLHLFLSTLCKKSLMWLSFGLPNLSNN